jgi:hypothetical protein
MSPRIITINYSRTNLYYSKHSLHGLSKLASRGKVHGILNASSKICSLVVNGQSFLVTDGSLLNLF